MNSKWQKMKDWDELSDIEKRLWKFRYGDSDLSDEEAQFIYGKLSKRDNRWLAGHQDFISQDHVDCKERIQADMVQDSMKYGKIDAYILMAESMEVRPNPSNYANSKYIDIAETLEHIKPLLTIDEYRCAWQRYVEGRKRKDMRIKKTCTDDGEVYDVRYLSPQDISNRLTGVRKKLEKTLNLKLLPN